MGWLDRTSKRLQEAAGVAVVAPERLQLAEAVAQELSALRKDYDLLGWTALDYLSGQPVDQPIAARRVIARKARRVWESDPMAGAAVDLLNDFTFSRGVPKPRARDEAVQQILDEAWNDVDNQAVLTSYAAQVALGTDLSLQSNLFLTVFDDGDDGRVKLSLMPHDRVIDVVRDSENPMRILYYVVEPMDQEWDFDNDRLKTAQDLASGGRGGVIAPDGKRAVKYYEHWLNCRMLREQGVEFTEAPKEKLAPGRIYHISTNRGSEMAFGVPRMQRVMRWLSGYNEVVAARVDMAKAAAAFIMKRKITGTPGQVARLAQQAVSRRSELGQAAVVGTGTQVPPAVGSVLNENDTVQHEPLKLDSGSAGANTDAQMIRAQVSAATRWPQHYLGDVGASSLAGATAIELPVLKLVEANQELFENLFRAFLDRVIERAVEVGKLDKFADTTPPPVALGEAADAVDEAQTERDLSYEFKMPSAMRRMMVDLITAIGTVARTFDPNNSNLELSKTLLTIALGEAFEMQDPAEAVDRIFPEGYVDPAVQAAQAAADAQAAGGLPNPADPNAPAAQGGAPTGGDGQDQSNNPYGAPTQGSTPGPQQQPIQQSADEMIEAALLADPTFREAWIAAVGVSDG